MRRKASALGNLLVLTHWSYNDALIQSYTLPYVKIIRSLLPIQFKIILVTSEQPKLALSPSQLLEVNKSFALENMQLVTKPYVSMGIGKITNVFSLLVDLLHIIRRDRVSAIHCFGTPTGSIGYVLSKLLGVHLIIDSYEPHAETMVENGTWNKYSLPFRLLFFMEKLQSHHANHLIGTSKSMLTYARESYGSDLGQFFVKPACVDLEKFNYMSRDDCLGRELNLIGKLVCVYAGKLGGIYLKEEVFDFILECYHFWGDRFRFLMLNNAPREEVSAELRRVGLPDEIVIQRFVPHSEVHKYIALGTFGLNPVKPVPTKRYCTSIKDGEYWASGLPIVITKDISDDSQIINDNRIGYVLKALTVHEYRNAIKEINFLICDGGDDLRQKIRGVAETFRSFRIAKEVYINVYPKI